MAFCKILLTKDYQILQDVSFYKLDLIKEFLDVYENLIKKFDRIDVGYTEKINNINYIRNYKGYLTRENGNSFIPV